MSLQERLVAAHAKWLEECGRTFAKLPDKLYHYTSGPGLFGILGSGAMWGTNFAFMNDRSEFQYGVTLTRGCLLAAGALLPDSGVRRSLAVAQKVLEMPPCDVYLTCFCEDGDLLSQWRGYGSPGSRYCIEFDASRLPRVAGVAPLANVVYDEGMHRTLLLRLIELMVEAVGDLPISAEGDIRAAASLIASAAVPVLTRFKDHAFHEEKEWRCVRITWHTEPAEVEFCDVGGMMRPYQVLVKSSGQLPILRVIAGASRSEVQAIRSARLMLRHFGYPPDVEVVGSSVPLQA